MEKAIVVDGGGNYNFNNVFECLKATNNFTETTYVNVCNGDTYSVPNGFWDYANVVILTIFLLFMMLFIRKIFDF